MFQFVSSTRENVLDSVAVWSMFLSNRFIRYFVQMNQERNI